MEVTRTLARYVIESRYADIPGAVRHEAARSFLNWVGCAVGASRHATVERTLGQETARSYEIDWSQRVILGGDDCKRRSNITCLVAGAGGGAGAPPLTGLLRGGGGPPPPPPATRQVMFERRLQSSHPRITRCDQSIS